MANSRELGTVTIIGAVDDYTLAVNVERHVGRQLVIKHKNEISAEEISEPIDAHWTSNDEEVSYKFDFQKLRWNR